MTASTKKTVPKSKTWQHVAGFFLAKRPLEASVMPPTPTFYTKQTPFWSVLGRDLLTCEKREGFFPFKTILGSHIYIGIGRSSNAKVKKNTYTGNTTPYSYSLLLLQHCYFRYTVQYLEKVYSANFTNMYLNKER